MAGVKPEKFCRFQSIPSTLLNILKFSTWWNLAACITAVSPLTSSIFQSTPLTSARSFVQFGLSLAAAIIAAVLPLMSLWFRSIPDVSTNFFDMSTSFCMQDIIKGVMLND